MLELDFDLWEERRQHDECEEEQRRLKGEALSQEVHKEILKSLRRVINDK